MKIAKPKGGSWKKEISDGTAKKLEVKGQPSKNDFKQKGKSRRHQDFWGGRGREEQTLFFERFNAPDRNGGGLLEKGKL